MTTMTIPSKASTVIHWPQQGEWTYEDYARLPDDGRRYEVIGGNLYMSPAPRTKHQQVLLQLAAQLNAYDRANNAGEVYIAPSDLILPDLASPVQPDIFFIPQAQLGMVKEKYIEGVPALIIELLSPTNPQHDRRTKYDLYAAAGVKEYWIVDPEACIVDVYALRGENVYVPYGHFEPGGVIQSELLPDLRILMNDVCQ